MEATNIAARQVESRGVQTFSAREMAFNILGLMHPLLFSITQVEAIWADLNGGMDRLPDLSNVTGKIWQLLYQEANLHCAITKDNSTDSMVINGVNLFYSLSLSHLERTLSSSSFRSMRVTLWMRNNYAAS